MEWIKLEPGDYESQDERFHIFQSWDRIHGNHWQLSDRELKQDYAFDSLKHCKFVVEQIIERKLK